MTKSEIFFQRFCDNVGIKWKRIPVGNGRTPDYDIFLPIRKVVVEVKEIVNNKEEELAEIEFKEKRLCLVSTTPGKRVRKIISDAGPQIKARAGRKFPGLLVLYNRVIHSSHTEPYSVRVAMYGFETIQIAVPHDLSISPYEVGRKYGGGRKMTQDANTSISAIAVLDRPKRDIIRLVVYHNNHARIPLEPHLFHRYGVKQYRLEAGSEGMIADWEEIRP